MERGDQHLRSICDRQLCCADDLEWNYLYCIHDHLRCADGSGWIRRLHAACCGQLHCAYGLERNSVRAADADLHVTDVLGRNSMCAADADLYVTDVLGWNSVRAADADLHVTDVLEWKCLRNDYLYGRHGSRWIRRLRSACLPEWSILEWNILRNTNLYRTDGSRWIWRLH